MATATPSIPAAPPPRQHSYGRLLDLTDLDGYLLSLLTADLAEVGHWMLRAKTAWSDIVNNKTNHSNTSASTAAGLDDHSGNEGIMASDSNAASSSSATTKNSWWRWEDLLALATILASGGQTPGTRALGFELVEPNSGRIGGTASHHGRHSFWSWLAGAMGSGNPETARRSSRLVLYVFLRIVLPRLYERVKAMGLEYCRQETKDEAATAPQGLSMRLQAPESKEDEEKDETKASSSAATTMADANAPLLSSSSGETNLRKLALQRKRLVVRTLIQWIDGGILPAMRLFLLLSVWKRSSSSEAPPTHGGNLALWWSGFMYRPKAPPSAASAASSTATTSVAIPLFVLYAHRRWLHQEALELLWNCLGRSLLNVHAEVSALCAEVSSHLRHELRMRWVRWSYTLERWVQHAQRRRLGGSGENDDGENDDDDDTATTSKAARPCPLCDKTDGRVPCQLDCCHHTACYVCLWERLASQALAESRRTRQLPARFPCPLCPMDVTRIEPV